MRIGIIGCGYVADQYMLTLRHHSSLELVGVADRDQSRADQFSKFHRTRAYDTADAMVADPEVEMILNLTNPRSHFEVSRSAIAAGKHVYSEKPLGLTLADCDELIKLADAKGVELSSAPSRVLGEPAQTMWKALREGAIGAPRIVYAEMDDGMLHLMNFREWAGASGSRWPWVDEVETGSTIEHAGYLLTWLAAFFGPALSVTALSSVMIPDRIPEVPHGNAGTDFSVACITYQSGVVARVTCSTIAPPDHSITVIGDAGVMKIDDCWLPDSPVIVRKGRELLNRSVKSAPILIPQLRDPGLPATSRSLKKVDFCLGPVEMVDAIGNKRTPRLSARFGAHIAETVLAIDGSRGGGTQQLRTTFDAVEPMPWAR